MRFNSFHLAVPKSTPPKVEGLCQVVCIRRNRRRIARAGSVLVAVGLLVVAAYVRYEDTPISMGSAEGQRTAENHVSPGAIEAPTEEFEPRMQVLARVVQPEPVFHVDPETQQAWQVGWIETEFSIPMDVKQFSTEQRTRFQNVLFQKNDFPTL